MNRGSKLERFFSLCDHCGHNVANENCLVEYIKTNHINIEEDITGINTKGWGIKVIYLRVLSEHCQAITNTN